MLTDFTRNLTTDKELLSVGDGGLLWLVAPGSTGQPMKVLAAAHILKVTCCLLSQQNATGSLVTDLAMQERISYVPHPKTLTRAGDYEYFAAQV